uniref:Endonuclease/exonuclease/phosphatase domain-containing protein n=1 Tax=Latimeria chalumnae TaxID=7897 RepID=H3A0U1_LATCH
IVTWNVRSMYIGKLKIVTNELMEIIIKVLGVSKTRWNEQGLYTINEGFTVGYIGRPDGKRDNGIGLITKKETAKAMLGYNPVNDRILTVCFQAHPCNLTMMQVYAPKTSVKNDMMAFYEAIQNVFDDIPKSDSIRIHGLGVMNKCGERVEEFCETNCLIIANTVFTQHPQKLYTWILLDGKMWNQTDYIMVNKRWRTTIKMAKTLPGADCSIDHQLLIVKVKVKLRNIRREHVPVCFNLENIPKQKDDDVSVINMKDEEEPP